MAADMPMTKTLTRRELRSRPTPPRCTGDDGSLMAEFAIVLPVLVMFASGIFEFGIAMRDKAIITSALRGSARVGAQEGKASTADQSILVDLKAGIAKGKNIAIRKVVIWSAPNGTGPAPTACTTMATNDTNGAGSTGAKCNVYSALQTNNSRSSTQFQNTLNNCSAGWDHWWCPTTRVDSLTAGPEWVGIWLQVDYTTITRVIPGGWFNSLTDQAIDRIEPSVN